MQQKGGVRSEILLGNEFRFSSACWTRWNPFHCSLSPLFEIKSISVNSIHSKDTESKQRFNLIHTWHYIFWQILPPQAPAVLTQAHHTASPPGTGTSTTLKSRFFPTTSPGTKIFYFQAESQKKNKMMKNTNNKLCNLNCNFIS